MKKLAFAALLALAACSQPPQMAEEAPRPDVEPIAPCSTLIPDLSKQVTIEDEAAAALPAASLRGGPINPGIYDLVRAVRIGGATGWNGQRAVVLQIAETDDGVVLNWSAAAPHGPPDTWTATLGGEGEARLAYTCGRIGEVDAGFTTSAEALDLRIDDGADGALHMVFARRP